MFDGLRNYFYERRKGFYTFAGVAGGVYMAGTYLTERLEEMREEAVQLQKARENLRKRFQQNQEDIQFTVMTHLPTLGSGVLSVMDVESVTQELQARSRPSRVQTHSPEPPPSESSLASSVELALPRTPTSVLTSASDAPSGMSESLLSVPSTQTQSWVSDVGPSSSAAGPSLAMPPPSSDKSPESPESAIGTETSASGVSGSMPSTSGSERSHSRARQSEGSEHPTTTLGSKSKVELWQEVKVLAFTRTLTIIYSTTLLTLLTTMQLNIIGRSKYIQSVMQLHREEKLREYHAFQVSTFAMFFPGFVEPEKDFDQWLNSDLQEIDLITPETERKFLTLSWWLLYVGWKDMGERVRRSVEEVFEGVSLKTRLGPMELHRLIYDVRRRVEHEITYEGNERRINFLSTLVPPSPETLSLVFGDGGVPGHRAPSSKSTPRAASPYPSTSRNPSLCNPQGQSHPYLPSHPNPESDPAFARLLGELRRTIASPVFTRVLEASLDRATEVLLDGLRRNVFGGGPGADMDVEPEKPRLANLLPGLARWGHLALNTVPNELIDSVVAIKEMTAFAALIYSNYECHLQPV